MAIALYMVKPHNNIVANVTNANIALQALRNISKGLFSLFNNNLTKG
jgi:hypothetical protein